MNIRLLHNQQEFQDPSTIKKKSEPTSCFIPFLNTYTIFKHGLDDILIHKFSFIHITNLGLNNFTSKSSNRILEHQLFFSECVQRARRFMGRRNSKGQCGIVTLKTRKFKRSLDIFITYRLAA